jgi:DNA-binding NarL/FixJ family response regulator
MAIKGMRILILSRMDIQLFCTGVASLLDDIYLVEIRFAGTGRPLTVTPKLTPDLILYFFDRHTLASDSRTINLCRPQAKLQLVFGPEVKWSLRHLLNLGADGAISSGAYAHELLHAINVLLIQKLKYISPLLIETLEESKRHGRFSSLSKREMDIALSMTEGKRNIEIASELNISPKIVMTHYQNGAQPAARQQTEACVIDLINDPHLYSQTTQCRQFHNHCTTFHQIKSYVESRRRSSRTICTAKKLYSQFDARSR